MLSFAAHLSQAVGVCKRVAVGALQLASVNMELRVRAKLGLSPDQDASWTYKRSDFSPLVRMLIRDADSSPQVLGKGHNEAVL